MIKSKLISGHILRKILITGCMYFCTLSLFAQGSGNVTGTVSDDSGPVPGAAVAIKGTTKGTATDSDGKFSLADVKHGNTLVISLLGYRTQEIQYAGQTNMTIILEEDSESLGEVVVTALGISKDSKKLGYAVTTISAKELTKTGTTNFATALYGKASGVRIQNTQGGTAGGISITVRGLSSFNGTTQPLVILNGVPIRNGNATNGSDGGSTDISAKDFSSIGSGGRIRSNGLVDINPEDIESLTVLKGAAATALYGSEAANGAIIITSKKAKSRGVTIDVNATVQANMVAYVPPIQSKYGPGASMSNWGSDQSKNGGFKSDVVTGYLVPDYTSQFSWGPAYDGRDVMYIDGKTRPYSAYSNQPWKELFRTGSDQIYNIAINQGSENASTRFSYTSVKEIPNALSGNYQKHNFNLVGSVKFNDHLSLDYTANYIVQHFVNRSGASLGVYGSWSNAFGSFLDIPLMKQIYKTPMGYYNSGSGSIYEPGVYDPIDAVNGDQFVNGVRGTLWGIYQNESDELEQRLISSVAPTWKITDFLSAKARLATDYTTAAQENRNHSEYPAAAYPTNTSVSGSYSTMNKSHQTTYGDIMLMFDKDLTDKINLNVNLGWQGRTEKLNAISVGTNGGLAIDNVFQLTNGKNGTITPDLNTNRKMELLKTAWVGTLGASYGDFIFVDLTGRQEKSSTLPKGKRDYFYPSASASFLYTTAFDLPKWYDFGKLRLSYGIVGNAPEAYAASMAYEAKSDPSGIVYNQVPSALGNVNLSPETTKEFEFGLESKFFGNRAGFEVSYYERRISDMLFQVPLAPTSGSSTVWTNAGLMTNKGVEATVYGTPVETKDFSWNLRLNLGFNKNHIEELTTGVPYIENSGLEGSIGNVRSYAGSAMGDYLSSKYKVVTDEKSQYYGRRIVNEDGSYVMNSALEVIGNAMPKVVGGLGTTLTYKNLQLDIMTDFRYGGHVFNRMYYLTMDTGVNADTENRSGEGFYDYTNKEGYTAKNGIILDGVVDNGGVYTENATVIPYDSYIMSAFGIANYGAPNQTAANALFKNNWWKLRELALSYNLPKSFISHVGLQNLQLSVFGRNLFYLYKAIPDYDPETSNGTDWKSQLVIGASASPTRTIGVTLRATF